MGTRMSYEITVFTSHPTDNIAAITQAEAGTQVVDPGGTKG